MRLKISVVHSRGKVGRSLPLDSRSSKGHLEMLLRLVPRSFGCVVQQANRIYLQMLMVFLQPLHPHVSKGVGRGGPGVPVIPPFFKPFLTKEPTTDGENAMTISWPSLKSPFFLTFDSV